MLKLKALPRRQAGQSLELLKKYKIAFVVEELTQLGGAERILDYFLEEFPKAPVLGTPMGTFLFYSGF